MEYVSVECTKLDVPGPGLEESRDSNETIVVILSARLFIVVLEFRRNSNGAITPERKKERNACVIIDD